MSNIYEQKLNQAKALIEKHNESAPTKVDIDKFFNCIKDAGATSNEALVACSWDDLTDCCLPKILAKVVANVFRSSPVLTEEVRATPITEKRVMAMTVAELVSKYDPDNWDNLIGKRLSDMTAGQPCLAFEGTGQLNIDASAKEVKRLREGHDAREFTRVNGNPIRLYSIGKRPGLLLAENPLYPGRALIDEECDQTGRSWAGISEFVRQLLYLAVGNGELKINQTKDAHDIFDLIKAIPADTVAFNLRLRFPKAALLHGDLLLANKLPTLKFVKTGSISKKQDPFHRTY